MKNLYPLGIFLIITIMATICLSFRNAAINPYDRANGLAAIPDLKIAAVTVSASPCGGNANKVRVMVYNGGSGPTKGKIQVRLHMVPLDSAVVKNLYIVINPNEFKTITFPNINLRMGDNRITAIANPNKTMPETNYKNNTKTASIKAPETCD